MRVKIGDIATIQHGIYAKPQEGSALPYLQAKHFSVNGSFLENVDSYVQDINIKALLRVGDVLFTSKGFRFFATCINNLNEGAVASSIFFVLKITSNKILPQFLEVILNAPKSVNHFQLLGAGHTIPSIRKNEVLDYEIELPSLAKQNKVIEVYSLGIKQIEIAHKILDLKISLFNKTLSTIIEHNHQ